MLQGRLTNEPRVRQQAVSVVLLQTARERAGLGLTVSEEISQTRPKTPHTQPLYYIILTSS